MFESPSFLAIADVHIGVNLYNEPEFGEDLRRLFSEACKLAVKLDVKYLVIAGDLYDTNKPTPDLIQFIRDNVDEARLGGVRVVGLAGDHDKPVNTESWCRISGIAPVDSVPQFIGCDFSDNPLNVINYIVHSNKREAQWLFLHAQMPSLWPFCDERKKIDLMSLPIFELYPYLRGVILGDIHKPYEGKLRDKTGKEAYVGYCGSLGITASCEIGEKIGLIHFDGQRLSRVPFSVGRDFVKIDLTTTATKGFEVGYYIEKYAKHRGRRPAFLVEYSQATKTRLQEIKPLYQLGFVRTFQEPKKKGKEVQQAVNIRSDLNNQERITGVLKELVPDEEVRALLQSALHTEDPKLVLDTFRKKYIG